MDMLRRVMRQCGPAVRAVVLGTLLMVHPGSAALDAAAQPPATTAAQDGFVPLDESKVQERLPAARLLIAAYALAWLVIFGYVWSLWARLGKVEREITEVSRRVAAGSRR